MIQQAIKSSRSGTEISRKRKEHQQKVLEKLGQTPSKKPKLPDEKPTSGSKFQELFTQRAQGFQIDFRFRNAPPRPPVGPCFVGNSIELVLADLAKTYKPNNAVEALHTWRLHVEPDLGVPLAPSAMDMKSYVKPDETIIPNLHPDDEALLNWKGSMGDTAAERRKRKHEQARAAARLAASGRAPMLLPATSRATTTTGSGNKKKAFSRVLQEDMQTWMKKTTYLSNDYSRKVHDFKSLAQTKSELAEELEKKKEQMAARRTVKAIKESFTTFPLRHPANKGLKPRHVMQVLPNVSHWGRAFTHVIIDKPPTTFPKDHKPQDFAKAFIANVEKRQANARMSCDVLVPSDSNDLYDPVHSFDLDVVPLKEEDAPHTNFCLWIEKEKGIAMYIPVASRVQLSTGRPVKNPVPRTVNRRPIMEEERLEMEKRMAEIDKDMAEKHHLEMKRSVSEDRNQKSYENRQTVEQEYEDDGEDDFGDDSDSEEEVFGGGTKTIVAD
jgi:RNA polymerase II-associated factor 1